MVALCLGLKERGAELSLQELDESVVEVDQSDAVSPGSFAQRLELSRVGLRGIVEDTVRMGITQGENSPLPRARPARIPMTDEFRGDSEAGFNDKKS